jgi:NAD(P)-dependent dehydrogenase (short-subunit alcohol dehydrogenase family)
MPSVLVTGASRGIGRAAALRLADAGFDVYAATRQASDAASLVAEGRPRLMPITLDITSAADIAALNDVLPDTLDGVVNNAGIVVGGPLEALPLDALRQQLEVNVIGQVAVTQAVLPRLRAAKGRLVFVSSVSGLIVTPTMGAYNASKFAIEAIADVFRLELAPWGIRVVSVLPAQTDTDLWRTADEVLETAAGLMDPTQRELYAEHIEGMRRAIPKSQKAAAPVAVVVAAIEKALTTSRPRARYIVGAAPRAQVALTRVMPTPVLDAVLRKAAGISSAR